MELTDFQITLLNWVKKARSRDESSILKRVVTDKEKVFACDGYRAHRVVFNKEVFQSNLEGEGGEILDKETNNERNYPDLSRFFSPELKPNEKEIVILLNPKFLKDAIEKMQEEELEIKIIIGEESKYILSPVRISGKVKEPKTRITYKLDTVIMPRRPD